MFTLLALATLASSPVLAETTGGVTGTVTAEASKNKVNTIVYVKAGDKGPATAKSVRMDQVGLMFTPHVLPIQVGWTVDFYNSDPVGHNVFTMDGEKYDLGTWPEGEKRSFTFTKAGAYRQLCRVHDDMLGYVVALDTARFAVSDKDGHFTLSGLPAGSYTLGVWHEKLAAADLVVTVAAGQNATVTVPLVAK